MADNHSQIMQKRYQDLSELQGIVKPKRYQAQKPRYQERKWLNDYQYKIYRVAMHGMDVFSIREINAMTFKAKRKILNFYHKAQVVLNLWKQQIINGLFEQLCSIQFKKFNSNPLHTVFKDTVIGMEKFGKKTCESFIPEISFRQLGITREQIIAKLVQQQVLPPNFYSLTQSPKI